MSMPQIPQEKYRPSQCEVAIDIIKAVALEETAISHILNSEGERCHAIVEKYSCCHSNMTLSQLTESIKLTEKILSDIIMEEWLLLKQIESVSSLLATCPHKPDHCAPIEPCIERSAITEPCSEGSTEPCSQRSANQSVDCAKQSTFCHKSTNCFKNSNNCNGSLGIFAPNRNCFPRRY